MDDDGPTREQLDDAIGKIAHQLELLRAGPTLGGPSDDRAVVAELEAELAALKRTRAAHG